jgi:hypothetical protein
VYPVRGQTLLLRAPWIREGHTLTTDKGQRVYTVPRKSGNVSIRTFVQHHHSCFPFSFWSAARETPTTGRIGCLSALLGRLSTLAGTPTHARRRHGRSWPVC